MRVDGGPSFPVELGVSRDDRELEQSTAGTIEISGVESRGTHWLELIGGNGQRYILQIKQLMTGGTDRKLALGCCDGWQEYRPSAMAVVLSWWMFAGCAVAFVASGEMLCRGYPRGATVIWTLVTLSVWFVGVYYLYRHTHYFRVRVQQQ
jgi:hypothetical protein